MAEELPETGEESGETVGTGLRARAWRGGGTRLGAPCRFGGAAGRAGPVLGEPTEAWRVGFSERVVPEPARVAAMGLVPAAKAQEQRLLEFGLCRAIWLTLFLTQGGSVFHAHSWANREALPACDIYLTA